MPLIPVRFDMGRRYHYLQQDRRRAHQTCGHDIISSRPKWIFHPQRKDHAWRKGSNVAGIPDIREKVKIPVNTRRMSDLKELKSAKYGLKFLKEKRDEPELVQR